MPKRKKRAKRRKPLAVTLRFKASEAPAIRALAKRARKTPRRMLHEMVRASLIAAAGLPAGEALRRTARGIEPVLRDDELATAVYTAAAAPSVVRFGKDKAFIASVFDLLHASGRIGKMSLPDFKLRLVELHRARKLRLARADLVRVMPPEQVKRSETRYQQAAFHFVVLP